jgi:hypothetical protein
MFSADAWDDSQLAIKQASKGAHFRLFRNGFILTSLMISAPAHGESKTPKPGVGREARER